MFNRPLPAPARDVALLIGRVVLGIVLFAHGWQKLMINGIAGTYGQFEKMGIPLAIVSASFTSFVEFVGGVLLIVGALTTTVVALDLVVMVGAAGFVHITHGIFAQDGGWELVGVIVAAELALAATGPGRYSLDHLIATYRGRQDAALEKVQAPVHRAESPNIGTFAEAVRQAPSRAPQHVGPSAQGPRYGGAGQVVGRVRVLEQPRTGEQARIDEQAWAPAQRPPAEQSAASAPPMMSAPPMTSALPVVTPAQVWTEPAAASSDEHWMAEQPRIVEQSGGYRPEPGFQPTATHEPAPMFDPAQRFAAARLLDAAPVTERFAHVGRAADADVPRRTGPTPKADAAPDIAQDVAAALTADEPRRTEASRPAEAPAQAEAPRPTSGLPQRAARSERVRMAATPFQ